MTKKIKLVIFDLDGTLVDAYKAVAISLNRALNDAGIKSVDDEIIKRSVGWGERKLISFFVPEDDIDKVHSIYRSYNKTALKSHVKFLPHALSVLNQLKEDGYSLAVATNRPSYSALIILKRLKIFGHFNYIVAGDDIKNLKPHPEMLIKIMKKLKVKPSESIFVGDMSIDVKTGNNAGVNTVAVVTGSSTEKEINEHKPYCVVEDLSLIYEVIKKINNHG